MIQADVLLVEDNPYDSEFSVHALTGRGSASSIDLVASGQDALDYLFGEGQYGDRSPANAPRLILMDLNLPYLSGLDVLTKIRADNRFDHVVIVMFSSAATDEDIENCYAAGANSFFVKPVDFKHFTATVRIVGEYWLHVVEPRPRPLRRG